MKNKKGGLIHSTFGKLVLVLLGFAILLVPFISFANEGDIDREVCHTSVLLRGTLPDTFDLKNLPSLNCKTAKFCITDKIFSKGDCEREFGEDKYETVRVSSEKEMQREINQFVARELASCWAMMGKGELQVFTHEFTTKKRCSICSRIAFDKELKDKLPKGVEELGDYLMTREVPNQNVSYWKYLTGQETIENFDESYDEFSTEEKAIVFIEMTGSSWDDWSVAIPFAVAGGKAGAIIGSIVPFGGTAVGGVIGFIGGGALGWFADLDGEKNNREYRTGWDFIDYDKRDLKGLDCSSFESIG